MKFSDIIIELFYHVGGLSLIYFSIKSLEYSWNTGSYPSLIGAVLFGLAGYYTGDVVKNTYNTIIKKEKYPIGLNF